MSFSIQIAAKINCSRCWKCLRTELSLELMGKLDAFSEVFDLNTYQRFRWLHLCDVLGSQNPLLKEIRNMMPIYGFQPPLSAKLVGLLVPNILIHKFLNIYGKSASLAPLDLMRTVSRKIMHKLGFLRKAQSVSRI